jgi:hypothetical protein
VEENPCKAASFYPLVDLLSLPEDAAMLDRFVPRARSW